MSEKLPAGWQLTKMGEVVTPFESVQPNRQPEESFRYVDIGCIDNKRQKIASAKTFKGREAPSRARRIMRENDVLFSTVRTYLRNIALVPRDLDGALTSTGICVLRASHAIDPLYLFNWARSNRFIHSMSRSMDGTMYPAVTDDDVLSADIILPPLNEQRRIVAKIEALTARIEHAEEALKQAGATALVGNFSTLRQSILAKAFRGELVPQDRNDEPASVLLDRIKAERAAAGGGGRRRRRPAS